MNKLFNLIKAQNAFANPNDALSKMIAETLGDEDELDMDDLDMLNAAAAKPFTPHPSMVDNAGSIKLESPVKK